MHRNFQRHKQLKLFQLGVRVWGEGEYKIYFTSYEKGRRIPMHELFIFISLVHEQIFVQIIEICPQLACFIQYERLNEKDHRIIQTGIEPASSDNRSVALPVKLSINSSAVE